MRRCVGCMTSRPKNELIRIAFYEGRLAFDPTGKAKGRGVYLCPDRECMEKARKRRSLQRSFESEIQPEDLNRVFQEIADYEQKSE